MGASTRLGPAVQLDALTLTEYLPTSRGPTMAQAQLPRTMRALRLVGYPRQLRVEEVPLPTPRSGQVLVRMDASPANPSDVMFTRGLYGIKRVLPTTPGFEGAGVAVYGKGMMAWFLSGKRVAVATQSPTEDGLWAEYAVVPAAMCVPIPEGISTEVRGARDRKPPSPRLTRACLSPSKQRRPSSTRSPPST